MSLSYLLLILGLYGDYNAVLLSSGLSISGSSLQGALGLGVPHELVLQGSLQLGVLER